MLRAIFIYLSKAQWARRIVTGWRIARRVASRFVAGDTLDAAIEVIRSLNQKGLYVTLDHLGEGVSNPEEARRAAKAILDLLDKIHTCGIQSSVSVKLTQLGLLVDPDLCLENMQAIVARAEETGNFVRIDMEDSAVIDQTLVIHGQLRDRGYDNLGKVIQSYLYRSEADTRALLEAGVPIRLVKGAYDEPAELAFPRKADVDANFDRLTSIIMDAACKLSSPPQAAEAKRPPITALGTHDKNRIEFGIQYAEKVGMPKDALEIQMLYGIRSDLQRSLAAQGYPVRVYVPYGTEWYPYFMRRLAERPANLWFFITNFFRK